MATSASPRRRERPAFFYGQLLGASDLQDLEAYGSDLRWVHNRSLHQPGIGSGFAVSGAKGDREVVIGPGYGIDLDGREIFLTAEERQAVPAVASESDGQSVFFDLTIAYADEAALKEAETRDGICLPGGAVRYLEAPEFCWVRLERDESGNLHPVNAKHDLDMKQGRRIRIARAEVLDCELRAPVSLEQRREARPPRLPHVAAGVTDGEWTSLTGSGESLNLLAPVPRGFVYAFTRRVDTCSAGFESVPWYTAHVVGPRVLVVEVGEAREKMEVLIVDQVHVQEAAADAFTAFLVIVLIPLVRPRQESPPPDAAGGGAPPLGFDGTSGDTHTSDGTSDDTAASTTTSTTLLDDAARLVETIRTGWQLSWMGVEQ
jgi:hypothetical protein